jgi:hypothetical protein
MNQFSSGAIRDTDIDKLQYARFLSPLVIKRYCEYLHKHRKQADGKIREPDNWKLGIPQLRYMDSKFRHFMDTWLINCGYPKEATEQNEEETLCAELFNTMGKLHEILQEKIKLSELADSAYIGPWKPYFPRCTIYVSHPICGKSEANATHEEMKNNCEKASSIISVLRRNYNLKVIKGWEAQIIDWYVPGEHDLVIQGLWFNNKITIKSVLDIDCKIVEACDGLYAMGINMSKGVCKEFEHANAHRIPTYCAPFDYLDKCFVYNEGFKRFISCVKEHYEARIKANNR